jgi:hypothetical protein
VPLELASLLAMSPSILLALGLLVVAMLAYTKRPRLGRAASNLLVVGASVGALSSLFSTWWSVFGLPAVMGSEFAKNTDRDMFQIIWTSVSLLQAIIHMVWVGLIIAAVFVRRPGQAATMPPASLPAPASPAVAVTEPQA